MIRVFNLLTGAKRCTFKRGIHYVQVYSLSFNMRSDLLLLSSSSGTLHVFYLPPEPEPVAGVGTETGEE